MNRMNRKYEMAVFAICAARTLTGVSFGAARDLGIAAVRRRDGRIGLPGGKVEPGESPAQALLRECAEEGWDVGDAPFLCPPVRTARIGGLLVEWYYRPGLAGVLTPKPGDVTPCVARPLEFVGLGNDTRPVRLAMYCALQSAFWEVS